MAVPSTMSIAISGTFIERVSLIPFAERHSSSSGIEQHKVMAKPSSRQNSREFVGRYSQALKLRSL